MGEPFWRQLATSPRFLESTVKASFVLWFILLTMGFTNITHLVSAIWVSMGVLTMLGLGIRHELGWVFIATAVVLQLTFVEALPLPVRAGLWPLLLLGSGVVMYLRGSVPQLAVTMEGKPKPSVWPAPRGQGQCVGGDIRQGAITCILRRGTLDLRHAWVSRPPALIEVTCVCGDLRIRLPPDWSVRADISGAFRRVTQEVRTSLLASTDPFRVDQLVRPGGGSGFREMDRPIQRDVPRVVFTGSAMLGRVSFSN